MPLAAAVIEGSLPRYESTMTAQQLYRISRDMADVVSERRRFYLSQAKHWQVRVLEEELATFEWWLRTTRYFAVLWHHYSVASEWGLKDSLGRAEVYKRTEGTAEQRGRTLDSWLKAGANIPSPLCARESGFCLNGEFLVLGQILSRSASESSASDVEREMFDTAAEKVLPEVYDALGRLAELPNEVKLLFAAFEQRFQKSEVP